MQEWIASKRVPPVLLLTGPSGIGKRTMGQFLAQWIFCEETGLSGKSPGVVPCGKCIQCSRAIKGSWVDFTEIRPEEDADGSATGSLKIDQFRKMKESLGFGSHEGNYRIFLIPDADRMTVQAANSLLKILEEPPHGWIFLLTASDATLVLPTVLSRCQSIKLKPFDPETLRRLLAACGVLGEKQKLGAALAGGSWGRALSLASDEIAERRQMLFDFLERPQGSLASLVDWAAQSDANYGLLSDQLELICLDLIRFSLHPSSADASSYVWQNFDGETALRNHAANLVKLLKSIEAARAFWIARAERIAQARKQALTPVNRKLLIQELLIPWLEVAS
jgi:DNA polymerase III delta' subunit